MRMVLDTNQDRSLEWSGISGDCFIYFDTHAGGTWALEMRSPLDSAIWTDISPEPNPFTDTGQWWFQSAAAVRYRLSGGMRGARAIVSNANGFVPEVF